MFTKNHLYILFLMCILKFVASHRTTDTDYCVRKTLHLKNALPRCQNSDYCLTLDKERLHLNRFSTKTAYRIQTPLDNQKDYQIENCEPSKIWLLIRHGTRLPTTKGIRQFSKMESLRDEIIENAAKLKTKPLCQEDWEALKNWRWNHSITESQANDLVAQGYLEHKSIAHNFKKYFPNLFDGPYDARNFHFRFTNTQRTRASFQAFVNELFGKNAHQEINAEPSTNHPDLMLKAYSNCSPWKAQKKQLKYSTSEVMKFQQTEIFVKLVADVNARLNFNGTLHSKSIQDISELCQYEQAWHVNSPSIWCSLLTPSQFRTLEYQKDLKYFYKSGHGSKLNKNIKCLAMNDMLDRLDSNTQPKTTVYFSHSAAILLFLTSLNALKDDVNLKANNFAEMHNRQWKTSVISPFAANIAIVRYTCPTTDQVKLFLNEKVLHLDGCKSDGVCNWQDIKDKFKYYTVENCEHFCPNDL